MYEKLKQKWETTPPIRGRAVDTRPIDKRSEPHKTVTKGDGYYGCALQGDEVIKYFENGEVEITTCGRWMSQLLTDFIDDWCVGGYAQVYDGHLWVNGYPVFDSTGLRMKYNIARRLVPVGEIMVRRRVNDNQQRKAVREEHKEFLEYAKSILTMTQGKVTYAMMASVACERVTYPRFTVAPLEARYYFTPTYEGGVQAYSRLRGMVNPALEDWLSVLCSYVTCGGFERNLEAVDGVAEPTYLVEPDKFVKKFLNTAYAMQDCTKYIYVLCEGKLMKDVYAP